MKRGRERRGSASGREAGDEEGGDEPSVGEGGIRVIEKSTGCKVLSAEGSGGDQREHIGHDHPSPRHVRRQVRLHQDPNRL